MNWWTERCAEEIAESESVLRNIPHSPYPWWCSICDERINIEHFVCDWILDYYGVRRSEK